MNDPLKFLERCPELAAVAKNDPAVTAAIVAGDGLKLHKALTKYLKQNEGRSDAAFLAQLLLDRRFFLTPIKKPPAMQTLNTLGTRLSGKSDLAADGTYISTIYFVFLFIPLIPIASYLVADAGSRTWTFYGRVPLGSGAKKVGMAWAVAAVIAALVGIFSFQNAGKYAAVHVVNGFDRKVTATVGKETVVVPPRSRMQVMAPTGKTKLTARFSDDPKVIEELEVEIPKRHDFVAYNILSVAPLYLEQVYYSTKAEADKKLILVPLCGGKSFVYRKKVEYLFTDPPAEIQMSGDRATHWKVELLPLGWRQSFVLAQQSGDKALTPQLMKTLLQLDPENEDVFEEPIGDLPQLSEWAKMLVKAYPNSRAAHRFLQNTLWQERPLAEADIAAVEKQGDAGKKLAEYLRARLADSKTAKPLFEKLHQDNPADRVILRALALVEYELGRFDDAAKHLAELKIPAVTSATLAAAWAHVTALIKSKRAEEAVKLADEYASRSETFDSAIFYGRAVTVANVKGPKPVEHYLNHLKAPATDEMRKEFAQLIANPDYDMFWPIAR